MKVVWSSEALGMLDEIERFIAQVNPQRARAASTAWCSTRITSITSFREYGCWRRTERIGRIGLIPILNHKCYNTSITLKEDVYGTTSEWQGCIGKS
jgi:hypothetical protein